MACRDYNMKKIFLAAIIIIFVGVIFNSRPDAPPLSESAVVSSSFIASTPSLPQKSEPEIVAENLDTPWDIAFLPNGDLLVTERKGQLRVIGKNAATIKVDGVVERGESGLTGLALHPDYAKNNFVYLYFSTTKAGQLNNKIVRYTFDGKTLANATAIVDDIPGGSNHNGGRLTFGPDAYLYILTGDAGNGNLAQDKKSLAGKILRVGEDGSIPKDNPFGSAVYSYGHRNPQGLVWDKDGGLWITEHGRSGVLSGYDEINYIEKGANYGWPFIQGPETRKGMKAPVVQSGPSTTWAPSGLAYANGKLYFAGLRGQALYAVPIEGKNKLGRPIELFKNEFGRLRAAQIGPDGALYFSTSNQDGRGQPKSGDDKIIKITPP